MSRKYFKITKCPEASLATANRIIVSDKQGISDKAIINVTKNNGTSSIHSVILSSRVNLDYLGLTLVDRQWLEVPLDEQVLVSIENRSTKKLASMVLLSVEFLQKAKATKNPLNTDEMAQQFAMKHIEQPVQLHQRLVFTLTNNPTLVFTVVKISTTEGPLDMSKIDENAKVGVLFQNTEIRFEPAKASGVQLKGSAVGTESSPNVINPNWDFAQMGIGGLNDEFSDIFRRAFASRLFPSNIIADLGIKHAKGILLYGPPGTGKTLMARQIGKMLNTRKPKIVQGPEILSKMVGESEANVRALFAEAEAEERQMGANSGLHMIIMDELDAICKQRGSTNSGTGVHDTVVNQLLSKIDGVEQLNNILIIGMTNRKDMIDDALLRPGRLEIHMEISLPSEQGRVEILHIHTATMKKSGRLDPDVNIEELAALTKNFSGAEIEGLVRAAQSSSLNSYVTATSKVEINQEVYKQLKVNRGHFMHSLEHDVQPAFGSNLDDLNDYLLYGIIPWSPGISKILQEGDLYGKQAANSDRTTLVSLLLEGENFTGKTALAVKIAINSGFPFTKIITPGKLVELADMAKIRAIYKIFTDAYKSEVSCVILDGIESLIEYVPIGMRFNMSMVQTIMTLIKNLPPRGKKLMIIATTSNPNLLKDIGLRQHFTHTMTVPLVQSSTNLIEIIDTLQVFTKEETEDLKNELKDVNLRVGIKKLIDICMTAKQAGDSDTKKATFINLLNRAGGIL
ncbi:vesicle-fusing ATPase-like [Bolinopsis microptera]|uniref:vesicle-fusing ATPase-like n=1 Tax=Bolinopsis microptera TaxID=2820187 RepID=UPI00307ACEED